jgi:hypothetical protein
MGGAKHSMIEAQERGWWDSDKFICSECIDEPFLATKAAEFSKSANTCSFCGSADATPINDLMPHIMFAIGSHYNEPSDSGMALEYMKEDFECTSTEEILYNLGIEGSPEFIETLVENIDNDCWADALGGSFYGSHKHEYWQYSWQNFCELVKHKNRYFFHFVEGHDFDSEEMSPGAILFKLQEAVVNLGLVKKELGMGRKLYRARIKDHSWQVSENQLRQPPKEYANAGRMNPAGISYFYAAEDSETAVKEVCKCVAEVAVGEFDINDELIFLDLTVLPELPSLFDSENEDKRQYILFLKGFIKDITKPISKDGKEHIDYVPTQIVSELFANQVKADDVAIDGIRFPSSINEGGVNWVLFPKAFKKPVYVSNEIVSTDISVWKTVILD